MTDAPPPGYIGKWMTPLELRRRNRELALVGRRICRIHQSAALPLDEAHFYHHTDGGYHTACIPCYNRERVERLRKRYQSDPVYAESVREATRQWVAEHRVEHRQSTRAWSKRRKAARFAQIIGEQP